MPRALFDGVVGDALTRVALPICADQGVRGTRPAEVRVVAGGRWGVCGGTGVLRVNGRAGVGVAGIDAGAGVVLQCVRVVVRGVMGVAAVPL